MRISLQSIEFTPGSVFAPRLKGPFTRWVDAELAVLLTMGERSANGASVSFEITWTDGERLSGKLDFTLDGIVSRPLARHVQGHLEAAARGQVEAIEPQRAARLLDHYEIEAGPLAASARRPPRARQRGAHLRLAGTFSAEGLAEVGITARGNVLEVDLSSVEAFEVIETIRRARTRAVLVELADTYRELAAVVDS